MGEAQNKKGATSAPMIVLIWLPTPGSNTLAQSQFSDTQIVG